MTDFNNVDGSTENYWESRGNDSQYSDFKNFYSSSETQKDLNRDANTLHNEVEVRNIGKELHDKQLQKQERRSPTINREEINKNRSNNPLYQTVTSEE
jgi:hypothetical protein